jgi:SAM-dependent methyltransferase
MLRSLCFLVLLCHSSCGPSDQQRPGSGNTEQVVQPDLQWHPSLYAGSARYYAIGRVGYPTALADALASELALDSSGRLLDVGCGPGNFTMLLAPWFEQAIGVDADRDMLAEAKQRAAQAGIGNVQWLQLRAEELPAGLDRPRVVSFAQSFHWMDQLRVARTALDMLEEGGACVHVHANTHEGVETDAKLPHPKPRHAAINELVERYLGPIARDRKGLLWADKANREEEVWRAAGFSGRHRIEVPGDIVERTSDQIDSPHVRGSPRSVRSRSSATAA